MSQRSCLNILMTTDAVGGVWTYTTSLSAVLAAAGHAVHLVTMGPRPRSDQCAEIHPRVCLIESDLALEWQDPAGEDTAVARKVLKALDRAIRPDVIHLNSFREASFDWNAPVAVGAHSCVNSWSIACEDTAWLEQPQWRHYTRAVGDGLRQAHAWVSPSASFRDVIESLYQPMTPGRVIWNGLSPKSQSQMPKELFILAAGRMWDRAKNVALLGDAAKGLEWPVCVAGSGNAGRAEAATLTMLGPLPHAVLQRQMQRAAIFASPAYYEPFGLSVLEAAAAGCALVLSDIPTFRELWDGAAIFIDPADSRKWHRSLGQLCADDHKRRVLQQKAGERARQFSLIRTAEAYQRLYRALLGATSREKSIEVHA
jgi:glycosyltransferase involved in cell wall biosynthesis